VTAKSITIDKGGVFCGQLVIGQADLTQGELLSDQRSAAEPPKDLDLPGPNAAPLPAT
jgi:hypothetical protein